jgi:hypothetical protein
MPLYNAHDSLPSGVTLSFLECQLTSSFVINSADEYRHWLIATVNHLLDKGECMHLLYCAINNYLDKRRL